MPIVDKYSGTLNDSNYLKLNYTKNSANSRDVDYAVLFGT